MPKHVHGGHGVFQMPPSAPTTGLVSLENDGLLIFQANSCHIARMPKDIDPDGTNPNAPATLEPLNYGSANPIVARLLMQTVAMLEISNCDLDKVQITQLCYSLVKDLLACQEAFIALASKTDPIKLRLAQGVPAQQNGRVIVPPQVDGLEAIVTQYLMPARRAIKTLCTLAARFGGVAEKDNNFEHLLKTFDAGGLPQTPLRAEILASVDYAKHLILLRNAQEHPSGEARLIVDNFRAQPDSSVLPPAWRVDGKDPVARECIESSMAAGLDFLLLTAEAILLHGVMHRRNRKVSIQVEQIPENQRDPANPVRIRLHIKMP